MSERVLTLRELNRTLLARQLLLEPATLSVPQAIQQLAGLHAQVASNPYIALWSRLQGFQRDDLARLIENRSVIKAAMMRVTLHLVTADDYIQLRGTLQPTFDQSFQAITKSRKADLDADQIIQAVRPFLEEQPRTFAEITAFFAERMPDTDVGAMRHTVRTQLPLAQVPTDSQWSYPGSPKFTLAESWLGQSIPMQSDLGQVIRRYLAAFGPAAITDIQTWSGIGKLKDAVEPLRAELVTYRDEQKRELFDLPEMPILDADTPAPVRFLPDLDNVLLSHQKRARIVSDEYRKKIMKPNLVGYPTILVDGFVAGIWKIEKKKATATLTIEPFEPIAKPQRDALIEEGEKLVRFVESDAKTHEVRFTD